MSQRSARRSFCLIAALAVCSGSALAVVGIDLAQVRLTWGAAPNAANYDVYRSPFPQGPFSQIATVTGTLLENRDRYGGPNTWYYAVMAADSWGNEGP